MEVLVYGCIAFWSRRLVTIRNEIRGTSCTRLRNTAHYTLLDLSLTCLAARMVSRPIIITGLTRWNSCIYCYIVFLDFTIDGLLASTSKIFTLLLSPNSLNHLYSQAFFSLHYHSRPSSSHPDSPYFPLARHHFDRRRTPPPSHRTA